MKVNKNDTIGRFCMQECTKRLIEEDASVNPNSYYQLLGVGQHATEAEIRSAYRKKSKDHHPGKHYNSRVSTFLQA